MDFTETWHINFWYINWIAATTVTPSNWITGAFVKFVLILDETKIFQSKVRENLSSCFEYGAEILSFYFQTIGGIRIMDCLSAKTYDFDDIAKIFVYSSLQSPFEINN